MGRKNKKREAEIEGHSLETVNYKKMRQELADLPEIISQDHAFLINLKKKTYRSQAYNRQTAEKIKRLHTHIDTLIELLSQYKALSPQQKVTNDTSPLSSMKEAISRIEVPDFEAPAFFGEWGQKFFTTAPSSSEPQLKAQSESRGYLFGISSYLPKFAHFAEDKEALIFDSDKENVFLTELKEQLRAIYQMMAGTGDTIAEDILKKHEQMLQLQGLIARACEILKAMDEDIERLDKEAFPEKIDEQIEFQRLKFVNDRLNQLQADYYQVMRKVQAIDLQESKEMQVLMKNLETIRESVRSDIKVHLDSLSNETSTPDYYARIICAYQQMLVLGAKYENHLKTAEQLAGSFEGTRKEAKKQKQLQHKQQYLATLYRFLTFVETQGRRSLLQQDLISIFQTHEGQSVLEPLSDKAHKDHEKEETLCKIYQEAIQTLQVYQQDLKTDFTSRIDKIAGMKPLLSLCPLHEVPLSMDETGIDDMLERFTAVRDFSFDYSKSAKDFYEIDLHSIETFIYYSKDNLPTLKPNLDTIDTAFTILKQRIRANFPEINLQSNGRVFTFEACEALPVQVFVKTYIQQRALLLKAFEQGADKQSNYLNFHELLAADYNKIKQYAIDFSKIKCRRDYVCSSPRLDFHELLLGLVRRQRFELCEALDDLIRNYDPAWLLEEKLQNIKKQHQEAFEGLIEKNKKLIALDQTESRLKSCEHMIQEIINSIKDETARLEKEEGLHDTRIPVLNQLNTSLRKIIKTIQGQCEQLSNEKISVAFCYKKSGIPSVSAFEKAAYEGFKRNIEVSLSQEALRNLSDAKRYTILGYLEKLLNFVNENILLQQPVKGHSFFSNASERMMFEIKDTLLRELDYKCINISPEA